MNQMPKRENPFARLRQQPEEEKAEVEVKQEEEQILIEEEEEVEEIKPVRTVKSTPKPKATPVQEEDREKFTSTMEVNLRRKIKIVCATRGIMFSQFVEDACREKLRREGEK